MSSHYKGQSPNCPYGRLRSRPRGITKELKAHLKQESGRRQRGKRVIHDPEFPTTPGNAVTDSVNRGRNSYSPPSLCGGDTTVTVN
jgi:hypothetical protein